MEAGETDVVERKALRVKPAGMVCERHFSFKPIGKSRMFLGFCNQPNNQIIVYCI